MPSLSRPKKQPKKTAKPSADVRNPGRVRAAAPKASALERGASGGSGPAGIVGGLFRTARELQGLSQRDLAGLTAGEPAPVSRAAISDIERGRSLPGLQATVSLAKALHLDPLEVLERVDLAVAAPVDLTGLSLADLRRRAEELYWSGDYRGALAVYDAMTDHLTLDPPARDEERLRLLAKIEIERATALRQCSALRAARASAERATQLAQGTPRLQAEAYMVLASLHAHEGLLSLSRDAAERSVVLAQGGSAKLLGLAWNQKGSVLHKMARFEEAREAFLQAKRFAGEGEDHHTLLATEGNIGACLAELGRRSRAREHFTRAIEMARAHADPAAEALWTIENGRLALADGFLDEADRHAAAGLRIARSSDRVLTIFRAVWLQHQVAKQRRSEDPDRHRLAYLKRLYVRVRGHRGIAEIEEFKSEVLDSEGPSRRSS